MLNSCFCLLAFVFWHLMITQKDVEHIANLARIELSEAEKQKMEKELSGILDFFEQLNTVNTDGVLPMAGGTMLENPALDRGAFIPLFQEGVSFKGGVNRMREDTAVDIALEEKPAELLQAVPEKKDGWVKVKAVFN